MNRIITFKVKLAIALVLASFLLFWPYRGGMSCVGGGSQRALRMQLPYEPVTLDYSLAEDGVSFRVLSAVMAGLVSYDRNYNLKLEIAEKMEKLEGGRRYRFTLRPWKWSDGKPVTAEDFVYAMKRTLEPSTNAKLSDLLFFIKGARAYKRGKLKDFSKVGIEALNDSTIEFTLEVPVGFFPHVLTLPVGYPQRADLEVKLGDAWPEHMASTGPYMLTRWLHDQRIEVERNPAYEGFDPKAPQRAMFQIIPEEATAVNLFENDRVDVLFKVPSFDLDRLRKRGVVHEFPYFATYYLAFDQRQAPWNDRNARLAVAEAIDRKKIVEAIGGTERVATSWLPSGLPGFNPNVGVKYDVAKAKDTWAHSKGAGVKTSTLAYDTSFRNQTAVERVQAELKEHLGLQLQLRNRDWKTYLRELALHPAPIYRFGWLSPFVDAYANLVVFESGNLNNYTGWKNKEYDALLSRIAVLEPGTGERQRLIDRAQRLLLEDGVVVIPIFHYTQDLLISPKVDGFWVNGMGMVDYMSVRFK